MEIVFLDSGIDLEAELRRRQLRRRRKWWNKLDRRTWLIIGGVLGSIACLLTMLAVYLIPRFVSFG